MTVSLILAMSDNGVIGRSNTIPWHLPADMQRFRTLTTGHTIVMGRKTFESIDAPLPGRRNVIVSRDRSYRQVGATVVNSIAEALLGEDAEEVFVIGGAEIFRLTLPIAQRLYLTVVHAVLEGDALLPELDLGEWELQEEVNRCQDEDHEFAISFRTYDRSQQ